MRPQAEPGFTLVETVIAAGVLAVSLVGLAYLAVVSTHVTMAAGALTASAVMAQQKMEQLRAIAWEDAAFAPSPAGTLDADVVGYVEYLDDHGRVRGDPEWVAALYLRRWAITPLSDEARAIEVVVRRHQPGGLAASQMSECRLISVRSRR